MKSVTSSCFPLKNKNVKKADPIKLYEDILEISTGTQLEGLNSKKLNWEVEIERYFDELLEV